MRITPCVRFKPVVFNGAKQDRISLANYKRFTELKLGKGSKVLIEYRNDTLSYCNKIDTPENDNIVSIPFIDTCPCCGEDIYTNEKETYAFCVNQKCSAIIIGKIERYIKTLDIKGIKENTISKLFDAKLVNTFLDLYTLDKDEIANIEGLGETSANDILTAIANKEPYDYEIIAGSSCIEDFGKTNAKTLLMQYSFYELMEKAEIAFNNKKFYKEFIKELELLDGFSTIKSTKVVDGLTENYDFLAEMYNELEFKEVKEEFKQDDVVYNIVFTGFRDNDVKQAMELRGHKVVLGGVSNKTDILVCMDKTENTVKLQKARNLGKEIYTLDEFKLKFNL